MISSLATRPYFPLTRATFQRIETLDQKQPTTLLQVIKKVALLILTIFSLFLAPLADLLLLPLQALARRFASSLPLQEVPRVAPPFPGPDFDLRFLEDAISLAKKHLPAARRKDFLELIKNDGYYEDDREPENIFQWIAAICLLHDVLIKCNDSLSFQTHPQFNVPENFLLSSPFKRLQEREQLSAINAIFSFTPTGQVSPEIKSFIQEIYAGASEISQKKSFAKQLIKRKNTTQHSACLVN